MMDHHDPNPEPSWAPGHPESDIQGEYITREEPDFAGAHNRLTFLELQVEKIKETLEIKCNDIAEMIDSLQRHEDLLKNIEASYRELIAERRQDA